MKPKHYYLKLYKMNYHFFLGWKYNDMVKYCLKKFKLEVEPEDAVGQTLLIENEDEMHCIIWTKQKKDYPILVHEVVHAANMTLDYIGYVYSLDNDEAQAYLVAHLFEEASS